MGEVAVAVVPFVWYGFSCTLGNYETINNASDILRKQIRHAEKAYLFQESDGKGKNPDAVPMTSSPAAAAPVWFLYKLFSDLGIYYYFAGEKRARERSGVRFLSAFRGVKDPSAAREG